ncbi:hypothetical protein NDJ00_07690, partial [Vibrio parahaemolyticus]|uniref:hypothetical protein n=1 Tax=Vibrio parahaemolyticus TaxID=670 RepID=UPI00215FBFB7
INGDIMTIESLVLSGGEKEILLSISPDWPMIIVTGLIGVGSILTSVLVSRISRNNQRMQSLARKAELRQNWVNELRESISKFLSASTTIHIRRNTDSSFSSSEEFFSAHSEVVCLETKVNMMLDPSKDESKIISSLMKDVYKNAVLSDGDSKHLGAYKRALEEQSRSLLEKAWNDIKRELN